MQQAATWKTVPVTETMNGFAGTLSNWPDSDMLPSTFM